jgi:CelD/BcsL family acetyltransferase involved in cellulose biosynthesis
MKSTEMVQPNTPQSPHYTVEAITHESALCGLERDWDHVSATSSTPNAFATYDWYTAWYRHLAERTGAGRLNPYVLTIKHDHRIRGIAPLTRAVTTQLGVRLRRLQFAGRDHEWDYNDLVTGDDPNEQIDAVAQYLIRTQNDWELADLMDVRNGDGEVNRIEDAMKRAGLRCVRLPVDERCPYMPIDGSWEQMLNRRSSSTRHSLRNRQSKLRRIVGDGLRVRVLDAPHTEPGLLERMIALEAQKRSGGVLSVPFVGPRADVFEHVMKTMGPKGWLCVGLLEWGERLLSWHLLFRCGNKLWGYLTAYDHEFAKLSPGGMLMPAIVDYGFERSYTEYDFLSGEETYKMQWATGFHERARILIWNRRWKSRLYATAFQRLRVRAAAKAAEVQRHEGTAEA